MHSVRSIEERFFEKVKKTPYCWEWTAHINKNGYGTIGKTRATRNKNLKAHRVSYEIHNGEIPDGLCVLHRCDNRRCVNPNHLFLGTYKDNRIDCVSKSRHSYGEKFKGSKLNSDSVVRMRDMYSKGDHTLKRLSELFNVSQHTVYACIHRETWKEVA